MKLGMRVPLGEFETLQAHIDFVVVDPYNESIFHECIAHDFPFWVDLSKWDQAFWKEEIILQADAVVVQSNPEDEFDNYNKLRDFRRRYNKQNFPIALHWGHKKSMQRLKDYSWRIGLSWERNRDKEDHADYHFHGFKTLDELRNYPPASLITNIAHYAVYSGIDLALRERRPQKLVTKCGRPLRREEMDQVIFNIGLIRKAAGFKEEANGG